MTALVIIGTGGHGREALDIVEAINARSPTFEFLGFIDDRRDNESLVTARGARILGPLDTLRGIDTRYVIGIGSGDIRCRLDRELTDWGYDAEVLVHPAATIGAGPSARPGRSRVVLGQPAHAVRPGDPPDEAPSR